MNSGYDANGNPVVYASSSQNNSNVSQKNTNIFCILGFIFSFIVALLGLIFSIIGLNQVKKTKEEGKGFAIAGIVISSIRLAFTIFIIIVYILLIVAAISDDTYYDDTYYYDNVSQFCEYASCDYTCKDGEYCACKYTDDYGNEYNLFCYVDWDINEKDYSNEV